MKGFIGFLLLVCLFFDLNNAQKDFLTSFENCNRTDCLLLPSKNCQSEDSKIVKLAENKFVNGTEFSIADNYFKYVLNRWGYSFYDNTKYGALGMLNEEA